ncbi:hypothetical protein QJS10_CPA10g00953 [Acorus calamus]|uniref:Uncharacterized protein n=1 Tax=Acorus calamus TaxID=4465 RepID=A0AAV9E140_ACOCL|nr:hypothetical protein QJS10_CPA10g00953 [Acorus calamus]
MDLVKQAPNLRQGRRRHGSSGGGGFAFEGRVSDESEIMRSLVIFMWKPCSREMSYHSLMVAALYEASGFTVK